MPRLRAIDPKTPDAEVRRFIMTDGMNSMRLQIEATPDDRDPYTGKIIPGRSRAIQWDNPMLATNRPDWIAGIEASLAWEDGLIKDLDVQETAAKEKRREALIAEAKEDPAFREKLLALFDAQAPEEVDVVETSSVEPEDEEPEDEEVEKPKLTFGKGSRS